MDTAGTDAALVLTAIGREDHGRLLAALATKFHDLDLAEEALADAMVRAVESWPARGVPQRPQAWLMTTAKNRAIDLIRTDATRARSLARLRIEDETQPGDHEDHADRLGEALSSVDIPDERLGLFFTCAHPTLREGERIVLILRFLAGWTTAEVAAAFLVDTTAMQQRIVRAKKRITATGIPFGRPGPTELEERLPGVLRAVYLVFTQGFTASTGPSHARVNVQEEAIVLSRLLVRLLPESTEALGLLALLLLTRARAAARIAADGSPIPLSEQDRADWNSTLIAEGLGLARTAAGRPGAGPYTVQAAIAALHAEAATYEDTDWAQILVLYRMLVRLDPSPVVALNLAVVRGRVDGPAAALTALDALASEPRLRRHRPFHIARAITLRELGRDADAEEAFNEALECPGNDAESEYIGARITDLRR